MVRRQWPTLDGPYRKAMAHLGACVGRRPLPFLLLPALIAAAFVYSFLQGVSEYRRLALTRAAAIDLFTPSRSRADRDRLRLAESFPDGGYFTDRTAVSPGLFIVLISAKQRPDQSISNVLDDRLVTEYRKLRNDIETLGAKTSDGRVITIKSLCQSSMYANQSASLSSIYEGCQSDAFLTLWNLHRSGLLPAFTYPYVSFGASLPDDSALPSSVYIGPLFGGVTTDRRDQVQYVKYVRMIFRLPVTGDTDRATIDRLGVVFSEYLDQYRSDTLAINYWVSQKYARDMQLISKRVVRLLPALIVLLLTFALISCCMRDCVLSKPWLAVAGVTSAGLGLQVGFAFLFVVGVDLIEIAMIVPFLVLSIGLDDTFVMLNVWRSTDPRWSVEKRMSVVFEEAAVAITITTVTDVAAFAIGLSSVFPAVRIFCGFCASALFAVFLYQMTFFGACMTYTGRLEAASRHCVTFRKVDRGNDDHEGLLNKIFCSTNVTIADSKGGSCRSIARIDNTTYRRPWPVTFFKLHFSSWLRLPWLKLAVAVSYIVYIGTSVFFLVAYLRQGLRVSSLVPYDSTTHDYLTLYEQYFSKCSTSAEVLISPSDRVDCASDHSESINNIDYSNRNVQRMLLDWALLFENTDYTYKIDFWLYEYFLYRENLLDQQQSESEDNETIQYDEEIEVDFISNLEEFLAQNRYRRYADHVIIDRCPRSGRSFVNASRFYVQLANMGFENRSAAMHLLRERTASAPAGFSAHAFDVSFPLAEQYDAVLPGVVYDMAVGVGCMLVVACLFVPNFLTCLCIAFTVFSINVGVLGYMAVWRVNLDIISTITILLSIGFSVDYTSHVAYHFYVSGRGDRRATIESKVTEALETAGWPILQSSLSMMVGVVTVLGVRAYIADTFVITILLVMLSGVYHSLIVLPVLLSVVSPAPKRDESPSSASTSRRPATSCSSISGAISDTSTRTTSTEEEQRQRWWSWMKAAKAGPARAKYGEHANPRMY